MKLRAPLLGALLGGLIALLTQAPAAWAAQALKDASGDRLQLAEARGTLWSGSAELLLSGGAGSRDASRLPGRAHWDVRWQGGPALALRLDCCSPAPLLLRLRREAGLWQLQLDDAAALRLPAAWLVGLGTPWNTLQPGGQLQLSAQGFALQRSGSGWQPQGRLQLDLTQLSSRVSTVDPLGSYRLQLLAGEGSAQLLLSTLDGALRLQGQGQLAPGGRLNFRGEAMAAPGREAALNNLLNIIGRRQGERSLISIG